MTNSEPRARERGGALLAVLWLSAALAAVAFSIAGTVKGETERTATAIDDVRSYYLATGAVERTILRMQWGGTWFAPNQPTIDYEFPNGTVHVDIIPEAAKLNINIGSGDVLFRILTALTHDEGHAQEVARAIVDWRSPSGPGGGGFDGYYLSLNPPFQARHGYFEDVEELLAVKGVTPDLFYGTYARDPAANPPQLIQRGGLRDCVSVYGAVANFDANGAAPALLESLGFSSEGIQALVAARPFRNSAQLSAYGQASGTSGRLRIGGNSIFTIRATARLRLPNNELSDFRRTTSAVIKLQPQKEPNYVVLRWYDRG